MAGESDVWLHSASVVILAKSHNPSIINRDFLAMHDIVPKEWDVIETTVTPMLAVVQYANGIGLQEDEHRLQIVENCDLPFGEYASNRLRDLASSYVKILPHVPYSGLGFNYTVSVIRQDPSRWINERFLKFDPWDKEFHMMPRFSVDMSEATLNLSMHSQKVSRKGSSQESVIVDCNLHYEGQFDAAVLHTKIHKWGAERVRIVNALDKVLGG